MSRRAHGLRAWLVQRITAVFIGIFSLYLIGHFAVNAPSSSGDMQAWLGSPAVGVLSALFFVCVLLHAWVGIRDVIMDYIKPVALKLLLLTAVGLFLISCGIWIVRVLLVVLS